MGRAGSAPSPCLTGVLQSTPLGHYLQHETSVTPQVGTTIPQNSTLGVALNDP